MKKALRFGLVALLLYVLCYCVNSPLGGYGHRAADFETVKNGTKISFASTLLWQPRFGYVYPTKSDVLGILWLPLIKLDRTLWHRDKNLFRDEEEIWSESPAFPWHPNTNN